MTALTPHVFLCNGALEPRGLASNAKVVPLSYTNHTYGRNVCLQLPRFVSQVFHLPPRVLDLLEIGAYVFAADRIASRGSNDAVELHAWHRRMRFAVQVRDIDFWQQASVKDKLTAALLFMTGDSEYVFDFEAGHATPPTSLFDHEEFLVTSGRPSSVVLFSGGLDSLAGALCRLKSTSEDVYLVSHRSGQPSTARTQQVLVRALESQYPGRVHHYSFRCGLSRLRASEESQRTRAFLFFSIAFALASRLALDFAYAYENGITSLNLLRRQDLVGARASRTTHPKTLHLMSSFLSKLYGSEFRVLNPFWNRTKSDVMTLLDDVGGRNLISSAVSCSKTFRRSQMATHCGGCFQCVDRRLAAYSAGLQDVDGAGIYSTDVFTDPIDSPETRTTALDYLRQALLFASQTDDEFYVDRLSELVDITDYVCSSEEESVEAVFELCQRHGNQVIKALKETRYHLDDPRTKMKEGCLLRLVADREYFLGETQRMARSVASMLESALPLAFQTRRPAREIELNDQIQALLRANGGEFEREFSSVRFCLGNAVPDHTCVDADLLVEAKFVRKGTPPSKVSEGIAADITKYPKDAFVLFVVYDPDRAVVDDGRFRADILSKRDCEVAIIR